MSDQPEWYPKETKNRKHTEELKKQEKTAKALSRIPKQLKNPDFRFVKILMKGNNARKRPFPSGWQKNNNYKFDDQPFLDWISNDNNFGVLCGKGDLAVIDADEPEISELVQKKLPKTFTVTTGSGGKHFYFLVPDMERKVVLYDKDHKHYGEIQFTGTQVIAPGSIHPNNKRYKVSTNVPIKTVSLKDIEEILADYIQKDVDESVHWENNGEFNNLDIAKVINLSGFKKQGRELQGPHPVHGSKTGSNFFVNPSKGTWHCFRCNSGGGTLSLIAVIEGIIKCDEAKPGALKGDVFKQVADVAQKKYNINIQTKPHQPHQPNQPHKPHKPHITGEHKIKYFLSKPKKAYQNIGRGIHEGVCYIASYIEDDDGKTHTALITSDREIYINEGKNKDRIRDEFGLHYREEFYHEVVETAWSNDVIYKWLYEDYTVDINKIFERLVKINKEFMVYEDETIHKMMALDILRSYFFFIFNENSRTHHHAEPGSGKTNQMNIFRALMFHPIASPDFSSASIYRVIEGSGGTILVDDFDDLPEDEKQKINRHIKVNYKRFKSIRADGGRKFKPQGYDAYSHFCFNNTTGIVDGITQERVVTYRLLKHKDAPKKKLDFRDKKFNGLRDDLYICLLQYWKEIKDSYDNLKVFDLGAREFEIFSAQLSIAKLIDASLFDEVLSFAKKYLEWVKKKDLSNDWEFHLLSYLWDMLKDEDNQIKPHDFAVSDITDHIYNSIFCGYNLNAKDEKRKRLQISQVIGRKLDGYLKFRQTTPHGYSHYHVHKKGLLEILEIKNMMWITQEIEDSLDNLISFLKSEHDGIYTGDWVDNDDFPFSEVTVGEGIDKDFIEILDKPLRVCLIQKQLQEVGEVGEVCEVGDVGETGKKEDEKRKYLQKAKEFLSKHPKTKHDLDKIGMAVGLAGKPGKQFLKEIMENEIVQNGEYSFFMKHDDQGYYWSCRSGGKQ